MRKNFKFSKIKSLNSQKVIFSDLVADHFYSTLFSKNVLHTAVPLISCKKCIHLVPTCIPSYPELVIPRYEASVSFFVRKCTMELTENDLPILLYIFRCWKSVEMTKTPQFRAQSSSFLTIMALFRVDFESFPWQKVYFRGF